MVGLEGKFVCCANADRGPMELLGDAFAGTLLRSKQLYQAIA